MGNASDIDLAAGIELTKIPQNGIVAGCYRGKPVILIQHGGEYRALSGTCTHMSAPLGEGLAVQGEVHCPWHHARFSTLTGEAVGAPAFAALERFSTTIRDGRVFVTDLEEPLAPRTSGEATRQVVIVGSGAAGYACAELLSRHGYAAPVTVISDDPDPPYDRTVCSKQYLIGMQSRSESLLSQNDSVETHKQASPTYRLAAKVSSLNTQQKFIILQGGERVDFDVLVLATGAEPKRPDWPGSDLPNVHVLRTLKDADAIIKSAEQARNVAVIGSSFIGLEAAASLRQRKLNVNVITPETIPLEMLLGSDIGAMIRTVHEEKGVRFHFGRKVQRYDGRQLTLDDDSVVSADFVVLGIGVIPRTEIASAAGIDCAPTERGGGVVVNERLETSTPGIFAIGDIARYPDPHSGERIRVEHWVHAQRQGQHVARVIMGDTSRYRDVPFFWSAHFDTGLRYLGHVSSINAATTDGSVEERNFSRQVSGKSKQKAYITCNRDMSSLAKEAEWDAKLLHDSG